MTKVTAVMTAHDEGLLTGVSIASFCEARDHARSNGIEVEGMFIIDRGDDVTKDVVRQAAVPDVQIFETDFGDVSSARNFSVKRAQGDFITFLDGDDLWSVNWLTASTRYCLSQNKQIVAHSEANVIFGGAENLWFHADSEASDFDPMYLTINNYWDAMCFTSVDVFKKHPILGNQLAKGYGYEDWHWNCLTLLDGIPHRPVPDTLHFKRRRLGSLLGRSSERDVVIAHTEIYKHSRELWSLRNRSKGKVESGVNRVIA